MKLYENKEYTFEKVNKFKCLDATISKEAHENIEIGERITKRSKVVVILNKMMTCKKILKHLNWEMQNRNLTISIHDYVR